MPCPDFICMGFQKCGTTTLFEILNEHPQIALCRDVKEPMYYRVPAATIFGGGKRFYDWRYFSHIPEDDTRLKGEVNAGLTMSGCAKKVSRYHDPSTKMIFMMRNPVDRSYSAYRYFLARGFFSASDIRSDQEHGHAQAFDAYVHRIIDDPHRRSQVMKKRLYYLVLSQSNYNTCIREYLDTFDLQNMKFIIFEEFIEDQAAVCKGLFDFLGVDNPPGLVTGLRANEGSERSVSPLGSEWLMITKGARYFFHDFCCMTHWAPGLYDRYNRYYHHVRERNLAPDTDTSRVLPQTRAYLMDYFADEIDGVSELCGRDLRTVWDPSGLQASA